MPVPSRPRKTEANFDIIALREQAGDAAFARGEACFADGAVELVSKKGARIRARVHGTAIYIVDISFDRDGYSGSCTCRAYEDTGFCKHMVATALAGAGPEMDDPADSRLSPIASYLRSLNHPALIELMLDCASRSPAIFEILERKAAFAALSGGDQKSIVTRMKQEIKTATHVKGYIKYHQIRGWVAGVNVVIDLIEELLTQGHGATVMDLARFLEQKLLEADVDDSDGDISKLLNRASQLHLDACQLARPDPVALARYLFKRETQDHFEFDDAVMTYGELLGEAGCQEMLRLAETAWQKLQKRRLHWVDEDDEELPDEAALEFVIDRIAARRGDLQTRIDIRKRKLSSSWDYLQLIEFCDANGRSDEAVKLAEEALFVHEDDLHQDLPLRAAKLFARQGRTEDAAALLWRTLAKYPSMEIVEELVRDREAGERTEMIDRAIAILKARTSGDTASGRRSDDDLIVQILIGEQRIDDAWQFSATASCSQYRMDDLAKASENTHPRLVWDFYAGRMKTAIISGDTSSYANAVKLIERMRYVADGCGIAPEQIAFEATLLERHQAKRKFVAMMAEIGRNRAPAK